MGGQAVHQFQQVSGLRLTGVRGQLRQDSQAFADLMEFSGGQGAYQGGEDEGVDGDDAAHQVQARHVGKHVVHHHEGRGGGRKGREGRFSIGGPGEGRAGDGQQASGEGPQSLGARRDEQKSGHESSPPAGGPAHGAAAGHQMGRPPAAGDQPRWPQQDPGPAQPAAEGRWPQQVVSPGPGVERGVRPLSELGAAIWRAVDSEPH